MNVEELATLCGESEGAEVLQTAYTWERERLTAAMRGCLAFVASVIVAFGASLLKGEISVPSWTLWVTGGSLTVLAVLGLFILLVRLPRQLDEFLLAARLMAALRGLR